MKKQRSDLVAGISFNEGIVSEILSRLEVKYVLRCKSVCKFWYDVINNKQFVDLHMKHNGRLSFQYIKRKGESLDTQSINSDGTKQNITYLDSYCTGFLLVERSSESDKPSPIYRLSNPSTKSILDLPDPHYRVRSMTIFQDSSTNSYYVFSVCIHQDCKKFQLLHLGGQSNDPIPNANLCWRTLEIPEYDKLSRQQRCGFSFVASKGILYILAVLKDGLSNPKVICFDLVKQQTCTTLDMPDQSLCLNVRKVCFQLCRGKPAVSFVLGEKLNFWVLEDYKSQKWADKIQMSLTFLKEDSNLDKVIPRIYCTDNGEVLLLYNIQNFELFVYNPKSKQKFTIPSSHHKVPATLVSVKGMQPEKKEC
ncbi:hypothetical protein POM88_035285 [Heracleum sosnowskyi]|uniref:F-box domain-containing protein n=1 Tax=Heracleum sosnowskyi TaxID=360622 RepID=A0AAD8HMT7_9APIA|nr:hypothetical protein POM88_035285 [Heracleum sosnowskyi]